MFPEQAEGAEASGGAFSGLECQSVRAVLGGCDSGWHCLGHHPPEVIFCGDFELCIFLALPLCSPKQTQCSFSFYKSRIANWILERRALCLHQVLLNILLKTWNTSGLKDTSGSLLSRHLSKCAFLQSEIALSKPHKSWILKILRDGDDATSRGKHRKERGKLGCEQKEQGVSQIKLLDCALHSVQHHSEHWICHISVKKCRMLVTKLILKI